MELAGLETRYYKELMAAARGNSRPFVAKLRAGDPPTPTDLRMMAALWEGRLWVKKKEKGGQRKSPSAYIRDHGLKILAAEEYRRRVKEAGGPGAIRGKSETMYQAVAAEFEIADWTELRTFDRQAARKHVVPLRS